MKKKRRRKRFFEYGAFLVIFMFFIFKVLGLFDSLSEEDALFIVEYGSIIQENEYDCLIVRRETLVFPQKDGGVKYFVNEGDKVRKGTPLYVYDAARPEGTATMAPSDVKRLESYLKSPGEAIDVGRQVQDIRVCSMEGDYGSIRLIESAMADKVARTGPPAAVQEPESRWKGTGAPMSGIVSFLVDGYEELLSPERLPLLDMEKLAEETIQGRSMKTGTARESVPVMKIIDNTRWYVYVHTDLRNIGRFHRGSRVQVQFKDETVEAIVADTGDEIGACHALLEIDDQAKAMEGNRQSRLNIINQNIEGLLVPVDALVKQGDREGVLVKDLNGNAVFKPVEIKGKNEAWAVVSDRLFYLEDDQGNMEAVDTIKLYDEILADISE